MDDFDRLTLTEIAEAIPDGSLLGVPADYSGVPMAATRALIARGARDLRLFCLPYTTIQGDMLIGAGCVDSVEAAAVTLGEHGLAPRFEIGRITPLEGHAGLIADGRGGNRRRRRGPARLRARAGWP